MWSVEIAAPAEEREALVAELWDRGCAGIVEKDATVEAFFEREEEARQFGIPAYHDPARDWVQVSRDCWAPLAVGERFYLAPEWCEDPTPEGRMRLEMHPGLACGSGWHEATQLCLEALECYVRAGARVADVGVGSGILSQGAALLGAGVVVACDTDLEAVRIARARRTAALLFCGSADGLRGGSADVAVSNIGGVAAAGVAAESLRCLAEGGVALVSGFETHEEGGMREAIVAAGGVIVDRREKRGWVLLVYARAEGGAGNGPRASSKRTASSSSSSSS
jgi:ribosomal protein L11 methyltransferase